MIWSVCEKQNQLRKIAAIFRTELLKNRFALLSVDREGQSKRFTAQRLNRLEVVSCGSNVGFSQSCNFAVSYRIDAFLNQLLGSGGENRLYGVLRFL
jgi:hypothetical protein